MLRQHVLEQIAQQLHRHILERQGRPVRQLQDVQTGFQRFQRRNVVAAENICRVRVVDQPLEIDRGNVVDIARQNGERQIGIIQLAQPREIRCRVLRIRLRHR